jgi:hypothetical protein
MNALGNWFCSSGLWRPITQKQLLLWLVGDAELGDALEIGAPKLLRERTQNYLAADTEPTSERACITRSMESRVTMPMICAPSPSLPLTTGI